MVVLLVAPSCSWRMCTGTQCFNPLGEFYRGRKCFSFATKDESHRSVITGASTGRQQLQSSGVSRIPALLTRHAPRRLQQPLNTDAGERAASEMGLEDSSLESTVEHRLWLAFGAGAAWGMVLKAALSVYDSTDVFGICVGAMAAYVLSDLGTGIYHWGIDNYGDAKTPVFGSQIDAFQGHHRRPWTITKREFANNIHAIARPVGFVLLPFLALPGNPAVDAFLGFFLGLVVMSQQFHAWAHSKKSQLPPIVSFLQDRGVLISRRMHGIHHKAPYSINYCIVSGLWNPLLNESRFFPALERAIFSRWRVAPRNWGEIASEWEQDGSYFEDGSDLKLDQEF